MIRKAVAVYPKEFVQRLREALPVSEVIGRRVPVKKKGREWEACCPFHQEKTPSFTINDQKGFYHCFGCSTHGDALTFLIEYEKLSYPEAIEALAREAGIAVPTPSPELARKEAKRHSLQEIMTAASRWYGEQLSLAGGMEARDYLTRRGVTQDMVHRFHIGYAPDDRQALKGFLLKEGATEKQLLDCGLIIQPDNGPSYDRFRGRIIFPILDNGGRVIAFGGRTLKKDDKAKYLNSPETELFHKGHVLYNWKQARAEVSDVAPLLVAEGYMDVIALHQAGFPQAVAPLGTALTETHLKMLWQACDMPVLCLDGDAAGQRAMWRSAELALPLLQPGKTLAFCVLPSGQDPDDFLKAEGPVAFKKLIDAAKPLSQVILTHLRKEIGEETPEQRAALENRLDVLASQIEHSGLQQHFQRYFREQLWQKNRRQSSTSPTHARVTQLAVGSHNGQDNARSQLHRQMIRTLLCQPQWLASLDTETVLMELPVSDPSLQRIIHWILECADSLPEEEDVWPTDARELKANNKILTDHWPRLVNAHTLLSLRDDLSTLKEENITLGWDEHRQGQISILEQQVRDLEYRLFNEQAG